MVRSLAIAVAVLGVAVPVVARAEPAKLTLDQVTAKALANPKAKMADDDRDSYAANVRQADAARYPTIKISAFGAPSPKIDCVNTPGLAPCATTDPKQFEVTYSGLYGDAEIVITQPLYTFGKIDYARRAARDGVVAADALADEVAGDIAIDAARAYWGVKLAREVRFMLDDGIEQIAKAQANLKTQKGLSVTDRQRVAVLLATAKSQRADAEQQEHAALAGLRALVGAADADVDDDPLEVVKTEVDAAKLDAAGRPQFRAASAAAKAADELLAMQKSYYWPDIGLIVAAGISEAQGVDVPPNAFWNNPYNRDYVAPLVGLTWSLAPWTTAANVDRARAAANKAHDQADLAQTGARYDADTASTQLVGAKAKLDTSSEGEKAAHTWLAAVLQNEAIGAAEPRDLADAYIAWFQMRAQYDAAIFQWNVAIVQAKRATGEFRAAPRRPR